jgi:hypothetical protein
VTGAIPAFFLQLRRPRDSGSGGALLDRRRSAKVMVSPPATMMWSRTFMSTRTKGLFDGVGPGGFSDAGGVDWS